MGDQPSPSGLEISISLRDGRSLPFSLQFSGLPGAPRIPAPNAGAPHATGPRVSALRPSLFPAAPRAAQRPRRVRARLGCQVWIIDCGCACCVFV